MSARRRATSPEELGQLARVHALLSDIDVARSPDVAVTTTNFETRTGRLIRLQVRNAPTKVGGWTSHAAITLVTQDGEVEINYLDVVSVQPAPPSP